MINSEILVMLKKHNGPCYAGVLAQDDVVWFKITKREMIYQLERRNLVDDCFDCSIDFGSLYLTNNNNV